MRSQISSRGGDDRESTLADLVRLAHQHQCIAEQLLARVEKDDKFTSFMDAVDVSGRIVGWNLTDRERDVAELLIEGLSNRRIARQLQISERTVKNHLHSIFGKLDVSDRTQAVIKLMRGA